MVKSALQKELRKKRPFDCAEQEAHLNLVRTADFLARDFADLFDGHDISGPQYNVLRILRGHGGDGLSCQEITAQMVTHMPDITRLVDRLESAGLAKRERIERDRRVVLVRITDDGLALLAELDAPLIALHKKQLKHLTRAELAELTRLLTKIRRPAADSDND